MVFQLEVYYKLDRPLTGFTVQQIGKTAQCYYTHASALRAATEIQPIEFKNQQAVPIRSLAFLLVDERPHPISLSMVSTTLYLGSSNDMRSNTLLENSNHPSQSLNFQYF